MIKIASIVRTEVTLKYEELDCGDLYIKPKSIVGLNDGNFKDRVYMKLDEDYAVNLRGELYDCCGSTALGTGVDITENTPVVPVFANAVFTIGNTEQ